ncbi:hypothetical protein QR680_003857 [Steinernema hermaphroditum]|uniref:CCHC-type domain-containing protein n=1 Tax=Steinernema hermaphroditum TaxID=289476 RepID=A0AA39LSP9_9BILA|nr:hypothetical protein QR680_003857 [Steinernema hermaphroditum]
MATSYFLVQGLDASFQRYTSKRNDYDELITKAKAILHMEKIDYYKLYETSLQIERNATEIKGLALNYSINHTTLDKLLAEYETNGMWILANNLKRDYENFVKKDYTIKAKKTFLILCQDLLNEMDQVQRTIKYKIESTKITPIHEIDNNYTVSDETPEREVAEDKKKNDNAGNKKPSAQAKSGKSGGEESKNYDFNESKKTFRKEINDKIKVLEEELKRIPDRFAKRKRPSPGYRFYCSFCSKNDHFTDSCRNVTDMKDRKKILEKRDKCLVCLHTHEKNRCLSTKQKCYYCGEIGKHHFSVCDYRTELKRAIKELEEMQKGAGGSVEDFD